MAPSFPKHRGALPVTRVTPSAYTLPTDAPEADGTLAWSATTLVLVELEAGDAAGLGYTYADASAAELIARTLAPHLVGEDAFDVPACMAGLLTQVRNLGSGGLVAMALSALDAALWDAKARALGVPLVRLLGAARSRVPAYGSGGFTSYSVVQLQRQLAGWVEEGLSRVKMKVGSAPAEDPARVAAAREAVGPGTELFVDANGAYSRAQALALAERFAAQGVRWFEEPVSSDDLPGLALLCARVPPGMQVAAGEYGDRPPYFRRMLEQGSVHVLQADATRCLGVTGFLQADALCEAWGLPLSAHCAPSLHLHPAACARRLVHLEYFHDHARLEQRFFDGVVQPVDGALAPDLSRPGLGLTFKRADAAPFAVRGSA
ncbi:mandelate racemase [Aggregicoccus sp. 17bor-14]|uniref:enolase C-terminal domain-like protein n=1 Tax=Myxococcaceae TaxID=31 RepID=UPI00129C984C|nr:MULTISPECIES: enolase C-terminal domain-like protein [Myxococcaceae]MBF5046500.1 mandelate racemase [Simulacricoccus sp. 17bor-14]MRI92216.1 mandelate racemase [Aggregicoccus sp. 17bor-14]